MTEFTTFAPSVANLSGNVQRLLVKLDGPL